MDVKYYLRTVERSDDKVHNAKMVDFFVRFRVGQLFFGLFDPSH